MQKDFPVNHITEETVRTAHAEGRLKISLKAALSALRNEQHTQLYGCIEATAEEKERSVRYSPQELVDIMRYIKSLLPQLPEQLQADTKDELIIIARIPHILKANPQLASFQQNYTGLFVTTVRYMSDPDNLDRFIQRTQLVSSMFMQGYTGKEAAKKLGKKAEK